jgi:hypothetical protein
MVVRRENWVLLPEKNLAAPEVEKGRNTRKDDHRMKKHVDLLNMAAPGMEKGRNTRKGDRHAKQHVGLFGEKASCTIVRLRRRARP